MLARVWAPRGDKLVHAPTERSAHPVAGVTWADCVHNVPQRATLCYMLRIGVRELRQNASMYLRDVQRGEAIEITHHGHPIAQLIPAANDPWTALITSKEVAPARISPRDVLARAPRPYNQPTASLADMRQDER